jgi:phage gp46-like protein
MVVRVVVATKEAAAARLHLLDRAIMVVLVLHQAQAVVVAVAALALLVKLPQATAVMVAQEQHH